MMSVENSKTSQSKNIIKYPNREDLGMSLIAYYITGEASLRKQFHLKIHIASFIIHH